MFLRYHHRLRFRPLLFDRMMSGKLRRKRRRVFKTTKALLSKVRFRLRHPSSSSSQSSTKTDNEHEKLRRFDVSPPLRDHLLHRASRVSSASRRREQPKTSPGWPSVRKSRHRRCRVFNPSRSETFANSSGKLTARYGRETENSRASVPTNARVGD